MDMLITNPSQSQLRAMASHHKNSQSHLWYQPFLDSWYFYALCVCDALPQALFFLKKWRSCDLYAMCVCDALPQALFFGKNDVPETFMPCNSPVEVFLRAAGALSPGKQWLTNGFGYICDGRGIIEAHPLKGLDSQMAPALAIASLWYKRLSPSKGWG